MEFSTIHNKPLIIRLLLVIPLYLTMVILGLILAGKFTYDTLFWNRKL